MVWRVAQSLLHLRQQVDAKFPRRSKDSDGTIGDEHHQATSSDHNPWIDDGGVGVVSAMDITHDPANGVDSYKMAEELRLSHDPRIKYVISNSKIFSSTVNAWEWRPYHGSNPHDHHVHVSVTAFKTFYDDTRDWNLPMLGGRLPLVKPPVTTEASTQLHEHIVATVFDSAEGGGRSYYTGAWLDGNEIYIALPYAFKGVRPHVRVYGPKGSQVAPIEDLGPWNLDDPYWLKPGARPQAESGWDLGQTTHGQPRKTNLAGIDLSPALARNIGIDGKGYVNWEFVDHRTDPTMPAPLPPKVAPPTLPVLPGSKFIADAIRAFINLFRSKP